MGDLNIDVNSKTKKDRISKAADRRASFRITKDNTHAMINSEALLISGDVIPIEIINFSFSGVLFYSSPHSGLRLDVHIPKISMEFRNKPTIELSGKIVRLTASDDRFFCGVSFYKDQTKNNSPQTKPAQHRLISESARARWLDKIRNLPNYMASPILESEELKLFQTEAYDEFSSIASSFSPEERWWFFEMLDELKKREPDYPKKLLDEFAFACEHGFPLPSNSNGHDVDGFFNHFVHWIRKGWHKAQYSLM